MKEPNKLLKISSIVYLLLSFFFIPYFTVYGGILLTLGIILLSYSMLELKQLQQKKVIITIIAAISVLLNIASAIMLFIALEKITSFKQDNDNAPPETEISSESKRIDLLLKIGLAMIFISGLLFATTSWESISDLLKVVALILMGVIFLGLSKFSEEKLKIEKTTKAYYILGLAFFLLTWVGIGVFGSISPWFSYTGAGKNLVYFLTFALLIGLLYLLNKKFPSKEYEYLQYMCCYLYLYHILTFIGLNLITITLVVSIVSLLINIFVKQDKLKPLSEVTNLMSYLYTPIIITQAIDDPNILISITSLINIVNVLYLATKTKDPFENTLSILISYTLVLTSIFNLQINHTDIVLFIIISLLYVLINHNKFNSSKAVTITNQILYNFVATICVAVMDSNQLQQIIFAVLYGVINHVNCYITNEENSSVDLYYQPVIIFMIVSCFINIINDNLFEISYAYMYTLSALVYGLIHNFSEPKKVKDTYFVALTVMTLLLLTINSDEGLVLNSVLVILSSIYLYNKVDQENETKKLWYYVLILLTINVLGCILSGEYLPELITHIIILIIFGTLTYLIKQPKYRTINYISLVVPLLGIVNSITMHDELKAICYNIFALYVLFLLVTLVVKKSEDKDLFATIGTSLIIVGVIFQRSILTAIYVGLLGILIIVITHNKYEYKKFFYCGIVITIINIIVQVGEFWTQIPLWLYLLLVGCGLIAFVTYKEANRKNEPPKQPKKLKEEPAKVEESPKTNTAVEVELATFCPYCGTQNPGGNYCLNCGQCLIIPKEKKN